MGLRNYINKNLICLTLSAPDRQAVIEHLAGRLAREGVVENLDAFIDSVRQREALASTYSGNYLAVPHGLSRAVLRPAICFARLETPVDWDGDGQTPVRFVFLIAINRDDQEQADAHLDVLSEIAVAAMDEANLLQWENVTSEEEFLDTLERIVKT